MTFDYVNHSRRPAGTILAVASRVVPGIGTVQRQVGPYADAWHRDNLRALGSPGPLWVAIGDSMTLGLGASAHDRGWVGQLAARLAAEGTQYRVLNLGFSGARVQDVLDRQLPALGALGHEPELVTVLIGSNDLLLRKYREQLPARYQRLLARLPGGAVVGTLPNPRPAARAVNELIYRERQRGRLVVAEMISHSGSWRGKLAADHFHPNDRGYAGMADTFYEAVRARNSV